MYIYRRLLIFFALNSIICAIDIWLLYRYYDILQWTPFAIRPPTQRWQKCARMSRPRNSCMCTRYNPLHYSRQRFTSTPPPWPNNTIEVFLISLIVVWISFRPRLWFFNCTNFIRKLYTIVNGNAHLILLWLCKSSHKTNIIYLQKGCRLVSFWYLPLLKNTK